MDLDVFVIDNPEMGGWIVLGHLDEIFGDVPAPGILLGATEEGDDVFGAMVDETRRDNADFHSWLR